MLSTYIITVSLYLVLFSPIINECTQYNCYDKDDCSHTHLTCANNQQCTINCNGDQSCIAATIECPSQATCIINCIATDTESHSICKQLIINATSSTLLNVYGSSNFNTLRSATVYCPLKGKCNLNGYGHHIMAHMDVYALQGFRDLTIDCERCHLRQLFCTEQFGRSCYIDAKNNACKLPCVRYNTDQTCNDYKYYDGEIDDIESNEITIEPTCQPSDTPSISPLITSPNTMVCPDSKIGSYNGGVLTFEVQMPYNGDIVFDASNSNFDIVHLKAYKNDNGITGEQLASVHNNILQLTDINVNNYIFTIKAHAHGIYDIRIICEEHNPTVSPSVLPSQLPTHIPTLNPSETPSNNPTILPSTNPSEIPSNSPTIDPSNNPSAIPTISPSINPSSIPTTSPSYNPSKYPSTYPTKSPLRPTINPVDDFETAPIESSETPSNNPSNNPSTIPTISPSINPSSIPTTSPSHKPTKSPNDFETEPIEPEIIPETDEPTSEPSRNPTTLPTSANTIICPGSKTGSYTSGTMTFQVQMPYNGDITFDASSSNFNILHLKAYKNSNGIPSEQIASVHNNNILQLTDVSVNNYIFTIKGHTHGIYDITITCQSNNPTVSPSSIPSQLPSNIPTVNPSTSPTTNPSSNPTPLPTNPGTIVCPDTITGSYNGGELQFEVQMPYDGALTLDARNSEFDISLTLSGNNNQILDQYMERNLFTLTDITMDNYIFNIRGNTRGIYNIIITCSSNNPTVSPTTNPLLPSINPSETPSNNPTINPSNNPSSIHTIPPSYNPSEYPSTYPSISPTRNPSPNPTLLPTTPGTVMCPDTIFGEYNGGELQFNIQMPYNGELVFDASTSEFNIIQLRAFENNNHIKTTNNNILTLTDVPTNNYIFTIRGNTNGTFNIIIKCSSNNPTVSPTINPSLLPSATPSKNTTTSPSLNPLISHTITCDLDNNCENTIVSDIVTVKITFEFESYVLYIKDNLNCFLYHILFEYFPFEWKHQFTVCDVEITSISGGNTQINNTNNIPPCNGNIPCFINTNIIRRRLLTDTYDGSVTIILSSSNSARQTAIQQLHLSELQSMMENVFMNRFNLNLVIDISIENTAGELIGSLDETIEKELPTDFTENKSSDDLMGHFSGTRDQWICVGIFLGIITILFPFEIYYTYKYWSNRRSPYIHSRHPALVTSVNIIASLFLIIERPMHAIHRLSVYNTLWFQWIRLLFYFISMQLLLGFVILRFWLLLFDIKWNKSMKNKEWKRHIDTNYKAIHKSFWRRSHATLGNYKFVSKYVITFVIALICIPTFLVYSYSYFSGSIAHGVILGIGTLLLWILWKKTPIYDDKFKIMAECGFVITWIFIAILCDLLFASLKIIYEETFWIWFLSYSVPFLLLTGVIFIQSYWVLLQMNKSKKLNSNSAYKSKRLLIPDNDNDESMSLNINNNMTLYEVLADKLSFSEFISHLLKEFSCENILSVIEMTQYKQFFIQWKRYVDMDNVKQIKYKSHRLDSDRDVSYISNITDFSDDDDDDDNKFDDDDDKKNESFDLLRSPSKSKSNNKKWYSPSVPSILRYKSDMSELSDLALGGEELIELPKSLPLSTIVWDTPIQMCTIQDIIKKIQLLYEKYIKQGCELELNISFKLRKELTKKYQKLNEMDETELYVFFDAVIESMMKLMQDSYTRFRMTKGFVKYETQFLKRKVSNRDSIKVKIKKIVSPNVSSAAN